MTHIEHLRTILPLNGLAVVDVGAGDGVYSRQLDEEGAKVTAIEIDPKAVSKAKSQLPLSVDVRLGAAEHLPLENETQNLACFFFSLHHVPVDLQPATFDEVCRVVRPGGRLHVVEPYPHGSMFEVVRLVEDETLVRTNSHRVLGELHQDRRFLLHSKDDYTLTREFKNFDSLVDKVVRSDRDRLVAFGSVEEVMESTYDRVVEQAGDARVLHQPCAAYHFEVVP